MYYLGSQIECTMGEFKIKNMFFYVSIAFFHEPFPFPAHERDRIYFSLITPKLIVFD